MKLGRWHYDDGREAATAMAIMERDGRVETVANANARYVQNVLEMCVTQAENGRLSPLLPMASKQAWFFILNDGISSIFRLRQNGKPGFGSLTFCPVYIAGGSHSRLETVLG